MTSPATPEPTEDFARTLRDLRESAGNPTLEAMARRTSISKSVLSDAFAGKRLPTERTVAGVVGALGGDVDDFVARRAAIDPTVRAGFAPVPDGFAGPTPPAARTGLTPIGIWLAVAAGVVGLVVGALGTTILRPAPVEAAPATVQLAAKAPAASAPSPAPTTTRGPRVVVTSGQDPADTPCVDDAAVAASEERPHHTQLQIVWSDACQAGWARITRYDGKAAGNEVSASIFRQLAPTGPDRQDTTEPGVQGAYTTLLVRPSADTRLCATGSITLDGRSIDLGAPVCL